MSCESLLPNSHEFDTGGPLLSKLGSFWVFTFSDTDTLRAYLDSVAAEQKQSLQNMGETSAAVSRHDIPVYHKEFWHPLTVKQSELMTVHEYFVRYAAETTYKYRTSGLTYGQRASFSQIAVPLPKNLVSVDAVQNRILDPSLTLVDDVDYTVTPSVILFHTDLFSNPLIPKRNIVDAQGLTTDVEILLWLKDACFDWQYVYSHFGYALGVPGRSSQIYKDVINALWDARVAGFSERVLRRFVSAVSGIPLAKSTGEIVKSIASDAAAGKQRITTDQNTYEFTLAAVPIVSVGSVLTEDDFLTDGLEIFDTANASKPLPSWVRSVPIDKTMTGDNLAGDVFFQNASVPLEYVGVNPTTMLVEVRFDIVGLPEIVEQFWQATHARGVADGATLATYLDRRTNKIGFPTANDLPTTINPAQFLIDNLVGRNLFFVRMKHSDLFDSSGLIFLSLLRDVLPPHTYGVLILEAPSTTEYYNTQSSITETVIPRIDVI